MQKRKNYWEKKSIKVIKEQACTSLCIVSAQGLTRAMAGQTGHVQ